MLIEQRAERQALHKLPRDSERDLDQEIERRVQERLAAQGAELESRIEARLLKRPKVCIVLDATTNQWTLSAWTS